MRSGRCGPVTAVLLLHGTGAAYGSCCIVTSVNTNMCTEASRCSEPLCVSQSHVATCARRAVQYRVLLLCMLALVSTLVHSGFVSSASQLVT
jgi:hypothetical protein